MNCINLTSFQKFLPLPFSFNSNSSIKARHIYCTKYVSSIFVNTVPLVPHKAWIRNVAKLVSHFKNHIQRISATVSIQNDLNAVTNSKHSYYKTYVPLSIHFRDFLCTFLHQHNFLSFQLVQYVVHYRIPMMPLELATPPPPPLPVINRVL